MSLTQKGRRNVLATSADEPMLMLLEITHADLAVPIRVVNDNQKITVLGNEYIACPFQITLADDQDQQVPKAAVSVDNIGRELTTWLETSNGGKGAKLRVMAVLPSSPDILEVDMKMDLSGLSINNETVDGELGYRNTMMRAAVGMRYDPISSPGVF